MHFALPPQLTAIVAKIYSPAVVDAHSSLYHLWNRFLGLYYGTDLPRTIAGEIRHINGFGEHHIVGFPDKAPTHAPKMAVRSELISVGLPKAALVPPGILVVCTLHDARGNQLMRCDCETEEVKRLWS